MLELLYEREHITQKELQDILQVQAGSLSELLGKLEKHGVIEREKANEDRRVSVIHITEAGKERVRDILEKRRQRGAGEEDGDWLSMLTKEEQDSLQSLLKKIRDGLLDASGETAPPAEDREEE